MELKVFNTHQDGGKGGGTTIRTIAMNRKYRYLYFNAKVVREHNLKKGDRVKIAQDVDSKNDWYVTFCSPEEDGCKLWQQKKFGTDSRSLIFYNKAAVNALLDSIKATYSATLIIAATPTEMPDGTKWYRVLTANPIRKD